MVRFLTARCPCSPISAFLYSPICWSWAIFSVAFRLEHSRSTRASARRPGIPAPLSSSPLTAYRGVRSNEWMTPSPGARERGEGETAGHAPCQHSGVGERRERRKRLRALRLRRETQQVTSPSTHGGRWRAATCPRPPAGGGVHDCCERVTRPSWKAL